MTPHDLIVGALVLIAAGVAVICALGVWLVRDELPRIHTQAPLTAFCLPLVAIALSIDAPLTPTMAKGLLLGIVSLLFAPLTGHALARAAHNRVAERPARDRSTAQPGDDEFKQPSQPDEQEPEVPAP